MSKNQVERFLAAYTAVLQNRKPDLTGLMPEEIRLLKRLMKNRRKAKRQSSPSVEIKAPASEAEDADTMHQSRHAGMYVSEASAAPTPSGP